MVNAPVPKRVDSVEVHNKGASAVSVTVTYNNHKESKDEQETVEVAAGAVHHFTEKVLDMGGWTAIAPITAVTSGSHSLSPSVDGVVKKLEVHVQEGGALKQGTSH